MAEDSFILDENDFTQATILQDNGWALPKKGEKAIVGVVSIKLEPNSKRRGQFKHDFGR